MIFALIFAKLVVLLSAPGDLLFIESDIREVNSSEWMESVQIVYIDSGSILAVEGTLAPSDVNWEIVDVAPVYLDNYRILYLAQCNGIIPPVPGEIILTTDEFVLIKLERATAELVAIPDIGFLRPLRVHKTKFASPVQNTSRADTVLVDEMVAMVSEESITDFVEQLEGYGTRYMTSPQYDAAADWADTMMASYGLATEQQTFFYNGDSMSNVIGEIVGVENPEKIYIICGHLDSISGNPSVAPGADDNGSGSASVIEAARVMSSYTFRNTVRFVLFAAEEAWMVGSEYYVEDAVQEGDDIQGAINLDMILYAPSVVDSVYIPYDDQSEALAIAAGEQFEKYSPSIFTRVTYEPSAPSDQASFWQYGYKAIEVAEASVDQIWGGYNPHYHKATDLLINYLPSMPYGTDMVRASVGLLATLAEPIDQSSIEDSPSNPMSFDIYPNPCTTGSVTIKAEGFSPNGREFLLYDLSGRTVGSGSLDDSGETQLDLQNLPAGVYSILSRDMESSAVRVVLIK